MGVMYITQAFGSTFIGRPLPILLALLAPSSSNFSSSSVKSLTSSSSGID